MNEDRRLPFGRTVPTGDGVVSRWSHIPDSSGSTITVHENYRLESVDVILTAEGEIDCSCADADCPHLVEMAADPSSSRELLQAFIGERQATTRLKLATWIAGERAALVLFFVQWGSDATANAYPQYQEGEQMFDVYWENVPGTSSLAGAFSKPLGSIERGVDDLSQVDEMVRVASEAHVGSAECQNKSHFRTGKPVQAASSEDVASIALFGKCVACQENAAKQESLVPDEDGGKGFPKG